MRNVNYRKLVAGLAVLTISIKSYFLDHIPLPGGGISLENDRIMYYVAMITFFIVGIISIFLAFKKKKDDA